MFPDLLFQSTEAISSKVSDFQCTLPHAGQMHRRLAGNCSPQLIPEPHPQDGKKHRIYGNCRVHWVKWGTKLSRQLLVTTFQDSIFGIPSSPNHNQTSAPVPAFLRGRWSHLWSCHLPRVKEKCSSWMIWTLGSDQYIQELHFSLTRGRWHDQRWDHLPLRNAVPVQKSGYGLEKRVSQI